MVALPPDALTTAAIDRGDGKGVDASLPSGTRTPWDT
jgi:hypothetical protein